MKAQIILFLSTQDLSEKLDEFVEYTNLIYQSYYYKLKCAIYFAEIMRWRYLIKRTIKY